MPDKSTKRDTENTVETPQPSQPRELSFKCKFCGDTKPLSELVMLRHYYPQLPACRACSLEGKVPAPTEEAEQ